VKPVTFGPIQPQSAANAPRASPVAPAAAHTPLHTLHFSNSLQTSPTASKSTPKGLRAVADLTHSLASNRLDRIAFRRTMSYRTTSSKCLPPTLPPGTGPEAWNRLGCKDLLPNFHVASALRRTAVEMSLKARGMRSEASGSGDQGGGGGLRPYWGGNNGEDGEWRS